MEKVADVHRDAALPKFHGKTFALQAKAAPPAVNREAPAFGRKAVLYATCFVNYNNPGIGMAARAVLAQNGVETEVVYPALLRHAAARAGRSRQGGGERALGLRRRCCPGSRRAMTSSPWCPPAP